MSDFVEDGSLAYGAIFASILGGSALAFAEGAARFVDGLFDEFVAQLDAVIRFEEQLLNALLVGWMTEAGGSWTEMTQALHSVGPFGMVIMGVQVLLFIGIFVEGGRRVGTF